MNLNHHLTAVYEDFIEFNLNADLPLNRWKFGARNQAFSDTVRQVINNLDFAPQ